MSEQFCYLAMCIFNPKKLHNFENCFNILWRDFTQSSFFCVPCGKSHTDLEKFANIVHRRPKLKKLNQFVSVWGSYCTYISCF